jgi:hypothetical protein
MGWAEGTGKKPEVVIPKARLHYPCTVLTQSCECKCAVPGRVPIKFVQFLLLGQYGVNAVIEVRFLMSKQSFCLCGEVVSMDGQWTVQQTTIR